ncbi:MAG: cell division ATP-binding protein FtsE [Acidiferrobacterales bacterium]
MIRFDGVSKRYEGGHDALQQVSFEIADEEMAFLTGHSGAGKSTLLKLIALIERPSRGSILINERNTAKIGRWRVPYFRREIGIVFQNNRLLMDRTVFDNVALPLVVSGAHHRELGRRVRAALDKVGLLDREKELPITLSGGEQQRVGIARAVVNKPPLLIADEPTGNLDEALSTEIIDLLADFNQHGVTVLIATHDLQQVRRLGCRTLNLANGQLVDAHA